jgi:ribonucleoside-triphosphate reductase (formate)
MNDLQTPPINPQSAREGELFVRQSNEELAPFDPQRIANALVREAQIAPELAQKISQEVHEQIQRSGIRALTAPLIRGLVDAKLLEYGLTAAYRLHARLGVPLYDVERAIQTVPRSTRTLHGPDGTSLALAEAIKREYAMLAVFSETVAHAHLAGDLHIENLGEVDRPATLISSLDFIKRYGVRLAGGFAGSRPARRPEVLAAHLVKHTAALHGYFSGALAWDSVNFALAPLLAELSQREMQQIAQALLFELSAPGIASGGQRVHCDLHLDWDCPAYLQDVAAVGAGGEKLDTTYGQHTTAARDFLKALFEMHLEGDGQGLPFTGPRLILHVTEDLLLNPNERPMLDLVSEAMARHGGVQLVFERANGAGHDAGTVKAEAFTARYGVSANKLQRTPESWQWRAALFSSVAINLPRLAYRAAGDPVRLIEGLTEALELAAQASLEKRVFLEKLLARGEAGALALLTLRQGKELFLPLSWTAHALCPVGLAELTHAVTNSPLGTAPEASNFANQIATHLHNEAERLSAKHKVHFRLGETHDPSAAHRFARLDMRHFGAATVNEVTVETSNEETAFYTNAFNLSVNHRLSLLERLKLEGHLQAGKLWNAASDVWLGERAPTPERMQILLAQVFQQTNLPALSFAPEFTLCSACQTVTRGQHSACPQCNSPRVDELAQANHRYGLISTWPDWKLSELALRRRDEF